MKVLLAEDDASLAAAMAAMLRKAGFGVDIAGDGSEADYLACTETYDVLVLDLGLPRRDGMDLLAHWRRSGVTTPVLILTARSRWADKAAGFTAGADDYVTKPFEPMEIVLRVKALMRRARGLAQPVLAAGQLRLDLNRNELSVEGQRLELTPLEYRVLAYLMLAQGRVVSRSELVEHVYERDGDPDSNVLDVLIGRVRRRLGAHNVIDTVRGRGFVVRSTGDVA